MRFWRSMIWSLRFCFAFFCLVSFSVFGQKEGNHWVFGNGAHVDFSSYAPVNVSGSGGLVILSKDGMDGVMEMLDKVEELREKVN